MMDSNPRYRFACVILVAALAAACDDGADPVAGADAPAEADALSEVGEEPSDAELTDLVGLSPRTVLEPGVYTTATLGPDHELNLGAPVRLGKSTSSFTEFEDPAVESPPSGSFSLSYFAFLSVDEMRPAALVGVSPFGEQAVGDRIDLPVDFGVWVSEVPQLVVTQRGQLDSEAGPVRWWDVEVDPEAGPTYPCTTADCTSPFTYADGEDYIVRAGYHYRIYQLGAIPNLFGVVETTGDLHLVEHLSLGDRLMASIRPAG